MDDKTPNRTTFPTNHSQISNSTNKRFTEVMAQYMQVHNISSLNPAVVTQVADSTGPQGDSYHQWDEYNPPTPAPVSNACNNFPFSPVIQNKSNKSSITTPSLDHALYDKWNMGYSSVPRSHGATTEHQYEQTPSVFTNTHFGDKIVSQMEPDSLEKKQVMPSTSICDRSTKNRYDSKTVTSCLPHLLMSEYTESPPYLPTAIQEAQLFKRHNFSQSNIQHAESSSHISISESSRIPLASHGSEDSLPPITTPVTHLVFESLADSIKSDQKKRRNICIGLFAMYIGAILGIIALAIFVKIQNKKFAPYNGMYPNGLPNSTLS